MSNQPPLPLDEQARRRKSVYDVIAQVRLQHGFEPDPAIYEYIERYARGEITLAGAIEEHTRRMTKSTVKQ